MSETKTPAAATAEPVEICLLVIYHCRGNEYWPCTSREVATERLDLFVQEWWSEECKGITMPGTPQARISRYFARQQRKPITSKCCIEHFDILKRDLLSPNALHPKKQRKKTPKAAAQTETDDGNDEEPQEE